MPDGGSVHAFAKEADLCAAFMAWLPPGWTAYPEWAGWDILIARDEDGFQIGIEAKLRLNAAVLGQAIETGWDCTQPGPDCRAVLVPYGRDGSLRRIATAIGLTVVTICPAARHLHIGRRRNGFDGYPELPGLADFAARGWHELAPVTRLQLPDYVPDVTAGASAPVRLTDWKIRAIKVCIIVERRGWVARHDFRALGIDHRRWMIPLSGWLVPGPRKGAYVRGPRFPDFRREHPRNFAEIEADAERWMPPMPPIQEAML